MKQLKKEAQLCHHAECGLLTKSAHIFNALAGDDFFADEKEHYKWMLVGAAMYRAGQLAMYKKMRSRKRKVPVLREVKSA